MNYYMLSEGEYSDYCVGGVYGTDKVIDKDTMKECQREFINIALGKYPEEIFPEWRLTTAYGIRLYPVGGSKRISWDDAVHIPYDDDWQDFFIDYFDMEKLDYDEIWGFEL